MLGKERLNPDRAGALLKQAVPDQRSYSFDSDALVGSARSHSCDRPSRRRWQQRPVVGSPTREVQSSLDRPAALTTGPWRHGSAHGRVPVDPWVGEPVLPDCHRSASSRCHPRSVRSITRTQGTYTAVAGLRDTGLRFPRGDTSGVVNGQAPRRPGVRKALQHHHSCGRSSPVLHTRVVPHAPLDAVRRTRPGRVRQG